ncbi:hypothetical protein OIE69_44420 (plasmid) [Actinacidiphila glaucinigra]|uniref:hypothetical protein n=1 Tax=Actinacidiphila glaucinigra TaxID=235986 RepID=UPI002DD7C2B5|nr:hypothetical protein [Actinacidiphila glaucinigra]WSD65761.1 hypothetical protein OIE69_43430 [Actinacidiphila glaucinigra]WSD65951.1 hypothetical protein OIE69_44420 [Actinacidiphila glaucinigra]
MSEQAHSADTAIRDYIRALLRQDLADETTRLELVTKYEAAGHRIVEGGQEDQDSWSICDWRTREVLASGTDGLDGYTAAVKRLDPDNRWIDIDHITSEAYGEDDEDHEGPDSALPASLEGALEDWIGSARTSNEDVAMVVGWSVDEVARHRTYA